MWQSSGHSHPAWLASTASPLLPSLLCCGQKGWVWGWGGGGGTACEPELIQFENLAFTLQVGHPKIANSEAPLIPNLAPTPWPE